MTVLARRSKKSQRKSSITSRNRYEFPQKAVLPICKIRGPKWQIPNSSIFSTKLSHLFLTNRPLIARRMSLSNNQSMEPTTRKKTIASSKRWRSSGS